jgi:hypothetical protein
MVTISTSIVAKDILKKNIVDIFHFHAQRHLCRARPRYIRDLAQWPDLVWDDQHLSPLLARVSREQGRLLGQMA